MRVNFTVNGRPREADDVWEGESLLLRAARAAGPARLEERLRAGRVRLLHGPPRRRAGVLLPGRRRARRGPRGRAPSRGCADARTATLRPRCQQAFIDAGAVQCGFCTPGLLVAADELLERDPQPDATRTSARRCPATCAAAPATRRSSTRSASRPPGRPSRRSDDAPPPGTPTGTGTRPARASGGIGESTLRPDGTLKVTGEFAYSSDMWHEDMLWGHTLRCPDAHAEIRVHRHLPRRWPLPGVYAVLTARRPARRRRTTAWRSRTPRSSPTARSATTASRSRSSPPTTRRPPAAPPPRSGSSTRSCPSSPTRRPRPRPARRLRPRAATTATAATSRTRTSCTASRSSAATPARPRARPTSSSTASTSSACRTRPSSARSPASPCPPRTAASTCTSPPSGCTRTCGRSRRSSACPRTRCG